MNILKVFISLAILLKCVTASRDGMTGFKTAVDHGDLMGAVNIYKQDMISKLKYVLQANNPGFIIEFIKGLGLANRDTLALLCTEQSLDIMKQVIGQVEFSRDSLIHAASEPKVFCSPEK